MSGSLGSPLGLVEGSIDHGGKKSLVEVGPPLLHGGSLGLGESSSSDGLGLPGNLEVRVQLQHELPVLEGVPLAGSEDLSGLPGAKTGLDFVGVDDPGKVRVGHLGAGEDEALLDGGGGGVGTEDSIQLVEGGLGPDAEATQVTSRGKLEKVQAIDGDELDTGEVAEGPQSSGLLIVDDQRSSALDVPPVPHLTLTSTDLLGVLGLLNIGVGTEGLEDLDGELGLVNVLEGVVGDNEGDFLDGLNTVTTGHDQSGESRGSQSRADSNAALVQVGLTRPPAPDLGRGEHTSTTTHLEGRNLV